MSVVERSAAADVVLVEAPAAVLSLFAPGRFQGRPAGRQCSQLFGFGVVGNARGCQASHAEAFLRSLAAVGLPRSGRSGGVWRRLCLHVLRLILRHPLRHVASAVTRTSSAKAWDQRADRCSGRSRMSVRARVRVSCAH